jgi:hypothetical protein
MMTAVSASTSAANALMGRRGAVSGASMNALCRAYDTVADTERAVDALLGAGVPGDDV